MKRRPWPGPGAPDIEEWDRWLLTCGRSTETRRLYVGVPRRAAAAGALDSPQALTRWLAEPSWSRGTRRAYGSALLAYLPWARSRGWAVPHARHVEKPTAGRRRPKPLTATEVAALMAVPDASPRTVTWIRLSMTTGLRAGEIARLRAEDVDLLGATLTVRGKGDKTRMIPLNAVAVDILGRLPERGQLWPGVQPHNVSGSAGRLLRRAGVPGGIHRCRHWHATTLLEAGVDITTIRDLLGHSSIMTTQIYLEVRPGLHRDAVGRLTMPALGGPTTAPDPEPDMAYLHEDAPAQGAA